MNIFLIGFMGSGKSYVGKRLAYRMKYQFLDLDEAIEQQTGQTIPNIFSHRGEVGFRSLEASTLRSLQTVQRTVVATGGGAPCYHDNLAWMLSHGKVIFLNVAVEILVERLSSGLAHRPLLAGKSLPELRTFIEDKLQERLPIYQQAHFTLHVTSRTEDVAATLFNSYKDLQNL